MYQWREVELNGGLTQLSFPLTSEPIQGTYNVVVQKETGTNLEHSFTVEEYGKKGSHLCWDEGCWKQEQLSGIHPF